MEVYRCLQTNTFTGRTGAERSNINEFSTKKQFNEVLKALKKFNKINLVFTMPNADLDSLIIFKMIKNFVKKNTMVNSHCLIAFTDW